MLILKYYNHFSGGSTIDRTSVVTRFQTPSLGKLKPKRKNELSLSYGLTNLVKFQTYFYRLVSTKSSKNSIINIPVPKH